MATPMIPDITFSDNSNQRTPCVLVLDGSTSMDGEPIRQLNKGLEIFEQSLKADPATAMRVQVLVIRIGNHDEAEVLHDWTDAIDFTAPTIEANGTTPLGEGMSLALDKVEEQKQAYDSNGISSTRPWIMMISDGMPTDQHWEEVAHECRDAEADNRVVIFPIGTETADLDAMGKFSNKAAKQLNGLDFRELFVWLSRSMSAVSASTPGDKIQLPAVDWAAVDV